MTEAEFDAQLRRWTAGVHARSVETLLTGTHGSGKLAESVAHYVDHMRDENGRHIAFRFEQYGVFRQYGAGRGWVIVNGVPVPGYRVVSLKDRYKPSKWGETAKMMLEQGYRRSDVREAKLKRHTEVKRERTPLDWIDGRIQAASNKLADLVQEYWGDVALGALAQQIRQAKIKKL